MNTKNVYQRIHAVMNDIGSISKNGRNDFHKYDYATEADFVRAIRPALKEHGLVIIPTMGTPDIKDNIDGKGTFLATAVVTFTIVNTDNPSETVQCSVMAQGSDKGDKSLYKLMTGAKKYFLALTFMVATGDDPENEGPHPDRKPAPKRAPKTAPTSTDDF